MILNNIHGVDKTLFHIKAARSYIQSNTMNGRSMPMRHVYLKLGGLILATFAAAAAAQAHEADGVDQAPAMPEVLSTVMPLMGRDTGVIIHRGPAVTPTPTPARAAYDPTAPRPILITQGDRRATTILRTRGFGSFGNSRRLRRNAALGVVFRNGDVSVRIGGASRAKDRGRAGGGKTSARPIVPRPVGLSRPAR
jgi:hypothetical protein